MSVLALEITEMGTGHNGDKSGTATTKTAIRQNGDTPKRRQQWSKRRRLESKRRQAFVKTATSIGQNGDEFWSKWRQSLVKTATVVSQRRRNLVGQNGNNSQSKLGLERIHQVTNTIRIVSRIQGGEYTFSQRLN